MSVYKSRHSGLVFSINASFHIRFQFFIFFSLVMALVIVSWTSYQTSVWMP